MTGPASGTMGARAAIGHTGPAVGRLERRADFVRVGKGRRWHGKALTLQTCPREAGAPEDGGSDDPPARARIGFTLTKKVGCAVVRNRARRRLREAVRVSTELPVRPDHDYVVVGRLDAIRLPFEALRDELALAVRAVHGASSRSGKRTRGRRGAKDDTAGQRPQDAIGAHPVRVALERIVPEP